MTANPVELIGGLTTNASVVKADLVSWAKARLPQVMADFTEARNTVLVGQLVITFKSTGGFWYQDTTDTTTADDGVICIVSLDGKRFKPLSAVPTPTSLGGVFASAAIAGQYVTGLDTAGNLLRASVDTDGTFASNSDTKIASQKAIKTYVDTVAQGLDPKASVLVATTANITLSGEQTLDGFLTAASRVLVKNQSTASQNGIYVSAAGAWTRSTDADAWTELPGAFVFVEKGTLYGDTGWVCTVDAGGTIGSTSVTFTQFSGAAGSVSSFGGATGAITVSGGIVMSGNDTRLDTAYGVRKLLATLTASASANLADTTSLTSTYKNYEIVFENVLPATNANTCILQVNSAGVQSTSYISSFLAVNQAGTLVGAGLTTAISLTSAAHVSNIVAGGGISGSIRIYNPSQTTTKKMWSGNFAYASTVGIIEGISTFGYWNGGDGAITGFQVSMSVGGNITSGVIRIYGWN